MKYFVVRGSTGVALRSTRLEWYFVVQGSTGVVQSSI